MISFLIRNAAATAFFCCVCSSITAQQIEKNNNGITVYPSLNGEVKAVRLEVITDKIIRVTASPVKTMAQAQSLAVLPYADKVNWTTTEQGADIVLRTDALQARVSLSDGTVRFYDKAGKLLLAERGNGRQLQPVVQEGTPLYALQQDFLLQKEEAVYGLGQHQDDYWNYKNRQVVFFQNNTEIAVPFLVSINSYGILWDNYALGKAGDVRPLQQLSDLQLFDKKGIKGWLTAAYANDRDKPGDVLFEKAESQVWYPFLNDTKERLAKEFAVDKGSITWEGSLATAAAGLYKFRFTYGGYLRCYINGHLQFDKWRQAWNPGTAWIELPMETGKKYAFKLEWIPDGGESYVSAGFIPPVKSGDENVFSFSAEAGRQIDYYFVHGTSMDEVISGYRKLTGKAPVAPRWAMGFWQSRERYKTQEEVINTVSEFRKRKVPLDNIVQDWFYWKENEWGSQEFDKSRFPDPDKMIEQLHTQQHAQLMISVWPKFYEGIPAYNRFMKNGWLYTRNIADRQKDWVGPGYVSTFYDVFNDSARTAFWKLLQEKIYSKKVDAWWMDASEPDILSNVSPQKRKEQMQPLAAGTAAEFLNAYPLQNAKGIYEGQRLADSTKRVFLLTRSAFAGSQRYAASVWSGDIAARWEDMRTQITAGLNYSLSGLPWWTMDIGGFAVEPRYEKPNETDLAEWRELQTRWYQWGSFLPLFRSHGQFPYREVFNIAPENHPAYQSMLFYNQLRYRLLPYLYSLAGYTWHKDYTIMRALVMDFAQDEKARATGDQFMLGPSLLVNPVYSYKATDRKVYLPAGQGWFDLYSGKYVEGGQAITAAAPYERVPVFVKEGSIIITGPALQYTAEKTADPLTVFVYAGKDASFELYEDEGVNYNYEKGKYATIRFAYSEQARTLTIEKRSGSFPGMLKNRNIRVVTIDKSHPQGMHFEPITGKRVTYKGEPISIKL